MDLEWERNFRTQMKRRREASGESRAAFAKRLSTLGLSYHQPTVQRTEDGERPVRLDEAFVIARALGTTVSTMTQSSSDELVDAENAQARLANFVNGVMRELRPHLADFDDVEAFAEQLTQSFEAAGGEHSVTTAWLAAWGTHGVRFIVALKELEQIGLLFDPEWETDWAEGTPPDIREEWPISEIVHVIESDAWQDADATLRPSTLAAYPVDLVQHDMLTWNPENFASLLAEERSDAQEPE